MDRALWTERPYPSRIILGRGNFWGSARAAVLLDGESREEAFA